METLPVRRGFHTYHIASQSGYSFQEYHKRKQRIARAFWVHQKALDVPEDHVTSSNTCAIVDDVNQM